ncbi:MAG TPA: reverse transcriptase domain-containing protein [Nakamurella sp.]
MPIPAQVLTGLTTHASPVSALRSMPQGPGSSRDFRLRRRLAVPHLPQGAPNSPRLANLVSYSLDRRIDAYSRAAGIRYTRYADDLTLSGGPELPRRWRSVPW